MYKYICTYISIAYRWKLLMKKFQMNFLIKFTIFTDKNVYMLYKYILKIFIFIYIYVHIYVYIHLIFWIIIYNI